MRALTVVANQESRTNTGLGVVLRPAEAVLRLGRGDVALGRIDVLPSLDGIESGLWALDELARRGVTVLNHSASLTAAHDKLATAAVLDHHAVPHPTTVHVAPWLPMPSFELPVVLKPRFGSWGCDVSRCDTRESLARALAAARGRAWFDATGGVLQTLVQPRGYDLRVLVARRRVVGAVSRRSAPGEWRTNVALGATRVAAVPPPLACELALAASAAVDGDLVGVDLLPTEDGGWTVLEVNGAADFNAAYSLGTEIFGAIRSALLDEPRTATAAGGARGWAGPQASPAQAREPARPRGEGEWLCFAEAVLGLVDGEARAYAVARQVEDENRQRGDSRPTPAAR